MNGKEANNYKEKGVTLLESIIATAIVAIGFIAVFQMVNYSVHSIGVSGERTKANYLAAMVAEDLIGDKNSIVTGSEKLKDKLLSDRGSNEFAWKMDQCSPGVTAATGNNNAYANKVQNKWKNWFSTKRLKCKSDKDTKTLQLFDICTSLITKEDKEKNIKLPNCKYKINPGHFVEATGDAVVIIGKMEVGLNNGKVKKALWFQVQ